MHSHEELETELLLQGADLVTDGSLGHVQLARGAGEALLSGSRLEGTQTGERRKVSHE